jgi:mRNA-degrading endonuclease RelE of RelBE toxin-antitoxin system
VREYRLLIAIEVVEFLERLPRRNRQVIRNAIKRIGEDPRRWSDAEDRDETGRRLEIAIVGEYALTYWIDSVDMHVKILDIHGADR